MHVFTDGLVGAMPARSKFAADNSQIIDDITLMPIDPNFPTTISNIFSWMKIYNFGPKISLKLIPKGPINNIPASVHILAWRQSGDKPLSEPMIVSLLTHLCAARSQWDIPTTTRSITTWYVYFMGCTVLRRCHCFLRCLSIMVSAYTGFCWFWYCMETVPGSHDDVMTWKPCLHCWPVVRKIDQCLGVHTKIYTCIHVPTYIHITRNTCLNHVQELVLDLTQYL